MYVCIVFYEEETNQFEFHLQYALTVFSSFFLAATEL